MRMRAVNVGHSRRLGGIIYSQRICVPFLSVHRYRKSTGDAIAL